MRYIPNILSIVRILMVGVFIGFFSTGRYQAALSVYIFAFATDVLDGRIARRFHWVTSIGKLLDPLADKLMTVTALICIYIGKGTPVFLILLLLVALKELLMIAGAIVMVRKKIVAFADLFGKLSAGLFVVGILLCLLSFTDPAVEGWGVGVLIAATCCSYIALVHYAVSQFSGVFGKRLP